MRLNGRVFEALAARHTHRSPLDLYHSALEVRLGADRIVIEMTPAWSGPHSARGVVTEGPVASRRLGRSRLFRYEVRRWRGGSIPDIADAVASPQRVSSAASSAEQLLRLVPAFPTYV